jgi:hypothetical protein
MTRSTSQAHSAHIPSDATLCDVATDKKASKALEAATTKYAHVLPGNIWRAGDGKHLLVVIRCTTPDCEAQRCVATSDCFQVKHCLDHKGGKVAKTETPEKAPAGVRSNRGTKGGRKAPKARKGNGKARKGRSGLTRVVADIKARASNRKGE